MPRGFPKAESPRPDREEKFSKARLTRDPDQHFFLNNLELRKRNGEIDAALSRLTDTATQIRSEDRMHGTLYTERHVRQLYVSKSTAM